MNIRQKIQRHVASAAAALAVSTFFIGAAISPAAMQPSASVSAQQSIA